jgi:hypothetical protein
LENAQMPKAWAELIEGLTLLARGRSCDISPLNCEHDQLTVLAHPSKFTSAELDRLGELGFFPEDEETFYSFRFGNA